MEQLDRLAAVEPVLPEEGVMFYTHFPKPLCCLVAGELESNGTFILLHLVAPERSAAW